MVDSIKSQSSLDQVVSGNRESVKASQSIVKKDEASGPSANSIAQVAKDIPAVINVGPRGGTAGVGKLVSNLNEAVKFSREALNALQNIAETESVGTEARIVRDFAKDLDRLKSDIVDLLSALSSRADTAGVIGANMEAADARLEDVEKAQSKAQSLSFNVDQALKAHGEGLTLEKVSQLLAD